MTAPRRRWSFGLRTLFVVMTVLGCWLGWEFYSMNSPKLVPRVREITPSAPQSQGYSQDCALDVDDSPATQADRP